VYNINLVGNSSCDVPSYVNLKPSCVMLRESQSLGNDFSVLLIYSPNFNLVFSSIQKSEGRPSPRD